MNQYEKFLSTKSNFQSRWIKYDRVLNIYVRRSKHLNKDTKEYVDFIDLANFSIYSENHKRKGTFTRFLKFAISKGDNIFIENVLNYSILPLILRHGFKKHWIQGLGAGNYYLLQDKNK